MLVICALHGQLAPACRPTCCSIVASMSTTGLEKDSMQAPDTAEGN